MRSASALHWTFVFMWVGWSGWLARYRWGVLRACNSPTAMTTLGGKAYLGPLQIIWGPR